MAFVVAPLVVPAIFAPYFADDGLGVGSHRLRSSPHHKAEQLPKKFDVRG
jgi:hypothetical protein